MTYQSIFKLKYIAFLHVAFTLYAGAQETELVDKKGFPSCFQSWNRAVLKVN